MYRGPHMEGKMALWAAVPRGRLSKGQI